MAMVCANCGKGAVTGISSSHHRGVAGRRWRKRAQATKRLFKPNLQMATIMLDGKKHKVKLCTKCIKRFKKEGQLANQESNFISA